MSKKTILYILLVLGLVVIGGGVWMLVKSPPEIDIPEGDSNFLKVLEYFNASTTKQITSKSATMVENGKTVTAQRTIPYPMGIILNFYLKDGSKVEVNVTSDNIWFETGEYIYEITVDPDFFPYLENLVNQQAVKESGHSIPYGG